MAEWKMGLLLLSLIANVFILNWKIPEKTSGAMRCNGRIIPLHGNDRLEIENTTLRSTSQMALNNLTEMRKGGEVRVPLELPQTGPHEGCHGPKSIPPQDGLLNSRQALCEQYMGLGLVSEYVNNSVDWCVAHSNPQNDGLLKCYTTQYPWESTGTFCEGFNVTIDFAQIVSGPIASKSHLSFTHTAFQVQCSKTDRWNPSLLMKQQTAQFARLVADERLTSEASKLITEPTYLLPRHEDVDNMFHSAGDWLNMEIVFRALLLPPSAVRMVLWDRMEVMWHDKVLVPSFAKSIIQAKDFPKTKVLFRHVIWHLEAPANIIHPAKTVPFVRGRHVTCVGSTLFKAYAGRILRTFSLWDERPPPIPHILLTIRQPKLRNIGRVLVNQGEVEEVMKKGNMLTWTAADMGSMSFGEQISFVRKANVLVGMHGAGLMWVLFLADEAVLVEIHPSYRLDRHFRHAARLSGKHYLPMRAGDKIECVGTSDRITIDIAEFTKVLDAAVRLARGFDDGVSECGLACPLQILSLDPTHDDHYAPTHTQKVSRPDLKFPCNTAGVKTATFI